MIIDCHTHAFPDAVAPRALEAIGTRGGFRPVLDGTVASLLRGMDQAGIDKAIQLNIATRADQFRSILAFCKAIRSDRLTPFPSVHPDDPQCRDHLRAIAGEGFRGIKLHPYYQQFTLDEERLFPLYAALIDEGLALIAHTGYDISYPFDDRCGPRRIAAVLDRFPGLRFSTSHLGAWYDYDAVRRHLVGRPVGMDIACSFGFLPDAEIKSLIEAHGPHQVFFGSDSPWVDQAETLARLRALGLAPEALAGIEGENARRFFGL